MTQIHSGELALSKHVKSLVLLRNVVEEGVLHDCAAPLLGYHVVVMEVLLLFEILGVVEKSETLHSFVEERLNVETVQIYRI